MPKNKVETGKIVLTDNPNLKGPIRLSAHLSHEEYPELGPKSTEVFSGQELFDDLASHHREEFRDFIKKRASSIMSRRQRRRDTQYSL